MLFELLKKNEFCNSIKDLLKNELILDIFIFGSSIRGKFKPNDIDLLILVSKKNQKVLDFIYNFRKSLEKIYNNLHIIILDYKEFTSENFVARTEFFSEAFSFRNNSFLAKSFGFLGFVFFKYNLNNFNPSKKILFHYSLNGRGKNKGILKEMGGKKFSDGVILVPIDKADFFKEFLESRKIKFSYWNVLFPSTFK